MSPARLLDIDPDAYHLLPGLSATTAKTLIARSPLHAWHAHPYFGAANDNAPTKPMDQGTACHTFLLGKGKRIACLPFDDWRTKAARETRAKTRKAGMVPMLHEDYTAASILADGIKARLKTDHDLELDGTSEQAMEWHEDSSAGPVLCRGMMDHVWIDRGLILDLKMVDDASIAAIERTCETFGYGIQASAYRRGLGQCFPDLMGRVKFLFLFVERDAPYASNLVEPDGVFAELGERRWLRAVERWGRALKEKQWPAYGSRINRITAPPWAVTRDMFADGDAP